MIINNYGFQKDVVKKYIFVQKVQKQKLNKKKDIKNEFISKQLLFLRFIYVKKYK